MPSHGTRKYRALGQEEDEPFGRPVAEDREDHRGAGLIDEGDAVEIDTGASRHASGIARLRSAPACPTPRPVLGSPAPQPDAFSYAPHLPRSPRGRSCAQRVAVGPSRPPHRRRRCRRSRARPARRRARPHLAHERVPRSPPRDRDGRAPVPSSRTGFTQPWKTRDALEPRRLGRRQGAIGAGRFIVRAWLMIVLLAYVAIFLALLIGLAFARQSNSDDRRAARAAGSPGIGIRALPRPRRRALLDVPPVLAVRGRRYGELRLRRAAATRRDRWSATARTRCRSTSG